MRKKVYGQQNKENNLLAKQLSSNPISHKIQKFGKSIRAKALPKYQSSTPLKQVAFNQELRRQSEALEMQRPALEEIQRMSISFIKSPEQKRFDFHDVSRSMLSKNKNVSFCDVSEDKTSSKSKSLRKSSILKNNTSSQKISMNSMNSHVGSIGSMSPKVSVKDKGVLCENNKYQNNLQKLKKDNKKYFDEFFPPGGASLYYKKDNPQKYKQIRWVRIDEVFGGQKYVLFNHQDRNIIRKGQYEQIDYLVSALNALGTSARCIERIFQNQRYNKYGIYYLRLNHGGIWKYILVDDYIPVKKTIKGYVPAFFNVKPAKSNYYELWPFLLHKALAKIYSTYENLMEDSFENCMHELTGIIPETIVLKKDQQSSKSTQFVIKNHFINSNNIIVAKNALTSSFFKISKDKYFPLVEIEKSEHTYFTQESQVKVISNKNQPLILPIQGLKHNFEEILVYTIDDSFCTIGCIIKQQKNPISLRKFKVQGYGKCNLSLIQKDKKYYRNNGYNYAWMRLILIVKDIDGYRWVSGKYGNQKILGLNCNLEPNQYTVLVIGQWNNRKALDITLNYQGNIQIHMEREPFDKNQNIVSEMCRDIAQRFGNFKQLNKNVCSYQHIDKINGFIIENFNNQLERQVYFHRKYQIPFKNYRTIGQLHLMDGCEIQGFIQTQNSVTLTLMLLGGIDEKALQGFKF